MPKRKVITIGTKLGETVKIVHLSDAGRQVVWVMLGLDWSDSLDGLMVQGVVLADGFLPIKIYTENHLVYPRPEQWTAPQERGISIKLYPLNASLVEEEFTCSPPQRRALFDLREKYQRMSPLNL